MLPLAVSSIPREMSNLPVLSRTSLKSLDPASRGAMLERIVEKNTRVVYDEIRRRAGEGKTSLRWEDWHMITEDPLLTNQERLDCKIRMKTRLLSLFPDARMNVDEPFSFLEIDWA